MRRIGDEPWIIDNAKLWAKISIVFLRFLKATNNFKDFRVIMFLLLELQNWCQGEQNEEKLKHLYNDFIWGA